MENYADLEEKRMQMIELMNKINHSEKTYKALEKANKILQRIGFKKSFIHYMEEYELEQDGNNEFNQFILLQMKRRIKVRSQNILYFYENNNKLTKKDIAFFNSINCDIERIITLISEIRADKRRYKEYYNTYQNSIYTHPPEEKRIEFNYYVKVLLRTLKGKGMIDDDDIDSYDPDVVFDIDVDIDKIYGFPIIFKHMYRDFIEEAKESKSRYVLK